jgi:DNA-directed RNA polymerase specialized sigma24 family protein
LQADEEDVTQNAFNSFFQGVVKGRFPRLDDRDDLWRLLVVITARKAFDQRHQERSLKRGGDVRVQPLSPRSSADGAREHGLHDIIGSEPTPEFAAQIADEYGRLMALLGDHALRQVAIWKMESFGNEEIAAKLGTSLRTVARKLETIRIIWQGELAL